MKVIVAGLGQVGTFITKYLTTEGDIDVVVIDNNPDLIRDITDIESIAGVVGKCTSLNILKEAGIKNADVFIAATSDDETNIFSCYLANLYDVKTKIAKIKDPNYLDDDWVELYRTKKIPVDTVISPNKHLFENVSKRIAYSNINVTDIMSFINDKILVFSLVINENALVFNETIHVIQNKIINEDLFARIIGIYRKNSFFVPRDTDTIMEGDKVFVSTDARHLEDVYNIFYLLKKTEFTILEAKQQNIIVNGDSLGIKSLALELGAQYEKVKLITKTPVDEETAIKLEHNNVQTIIDDITVDGYRSNYIYSSDDIIIIMNKEDKTTVLDTILLYNQGMKNIICFLKSKYYEKFLLNNGITNIVIVDSFIMSPILPIIRRGVIFSIISISDSVELVELEVIDNTYAIGKKVSEIQSLSLTICGIIDENLENIIKLEDDPVIKSGYRIIYLINKDKISEAENIFAQHIDSDVII